MDAILVKLLVLRFRGGVRHRLRELKTLRGLLFLCVTVAVIALLMKQTALPANPLDGAVADGPDLLRGQLARWMPVGLLAACLLTVLTAPGPAIHFSPSEINLLFSAPFSRRALLLYKMCFYAFGALLSSLLIMLLLPAFTQLPVAAFAGAFLTLIFIQLSSAVIGLVSQRLAGYCPVPLRRSHLLLLAVLVALHGWYLSSAGSGLSDALARFQSSPAGLLLLAPFEVFVQIILASSIYPDLLHWATLGVVINVALLGSIILLDRYSYEASIAASLALHKRWVRARRSGLLWGTQPAVMVRSFKPPPAIGGIGPIAWRQLLTALRSSGKAVLVFLAAAMLAGPLLVVAAADISLWSRAGFVFFVAIYVLPRSLVFDFRSDLESMENFKALPLRPWKICAGQLAAPAVLGSVIELLLLGSVALCLEGAARLIAVGLMPFIVPFNVLLYSLENLLFLLFPTPLVPVGRVDFDFLGRTMVDFAVKTALLIGGCGLAAGAGMLVLEATNRSWPASAVVAWCSLALIAIALLPVLSWAFDRFDVSRP